MLNEFLKFFSINEKIVYSGDLYNDFIMQLQCEGRE